MYATTTGSVRPARLDVALDKPARTTRATLILGSVTIRRSP